MPEFVVNALRKLLCCNSSRNVQSDDMETPIHRKNSTSHSKSDFSVDRVPTPSIDRLTAVLTHATHLLPTLKATTDMNICRTTIEDAQVHGRITAHQNNGMQKYLNYVEMDWKKWATALKNELETLEHERCVTKTEKGVMVVSQDMDRGRRKVTMMRVDEAMKMIGEYKSLVDEITIHGEMGLVKATQKLQELEEEKQG